MHGLQFRLAAQGGVEGRYNKCRDKQRFFAAGKEV